MTAERLQEVLEKHKKWIRSEEGGERANLYGANLYGATLSGATLYGANLSGATLYGATLSGATLYGATLYGATLYGATLYGATLSGAKINWQSHALMAKLLFDAAGEDPDKRAVAGLIHLSPDWCWDKFLSLEHPLTEWALTTLATAVQDGDEAPKELLIRVPKGDETEKISHEEVA